jgi:DNA polymerase-1
MLEVHRRLRATGLRARMLLQVHDELVLEAPEDEVPAASTVVREAMERVWPLRVPLQVDVRAGDTWREAH